MDYEDDRDEMWVEPNDYTNLPGAYDADLVFSCQRRDSWDSDTDSSSYPSPRSKIIKRKPAVMSNMWSQLRSCLDNVHDGTFATSGALPNAANRGIFIPCIGVVGLPMSDRDAKVIMDVVHQDHNRAGRSPSFISPPTRSYDLDPDQFEIQNSMWQQTPMEAIAKTATRLGFKKHTKSVQAELVKLRICRSEDSVDDQLQRACSINITT